MEDEDLAVYDNEETIHISNLKILYENLLRPVFGEQFRIDDSQEGRNWVTVILDGEQEDFMFSLYGTDCVRLYWCNECFIFDKHRNSLVSSDTYGEIVYEGTFDIGRLPQMIAELILQLKDCVYAGKKEIVKGKTPSGYDTVKDYIVRAKTGEPSKGSYKLANITIEYSCGEQ